MTETKTGQKRLRADAERNRQRLLQAAKEVFARDGASASLEEIARTAGVGATHAACNTHSSAL